MTIVQHIGARDLDKTRSVEPVVPCREIFTTLIELERRREPRLYSFQELKISYGIIYPTVARLRALERTAFFNKSSRVKTRDVSIV